MDKNSPISRISKWLFDEFNLRIFRISEDETFFREINKFSERFAEDEITITD